MTDRLPGIAAGAHVDPSAELAADVAVAAGAVLAAGVRIGAGTSIGAGVVLEPGVEVGPGCVVEPCAVLGKRPRLRAGSSAAGVELEPLRVEGGATVCCGAVLYAGATIGEAVIIGDQAQVREGASIGSRSVVGRASCVDFRARVGARVLIQTGVYVTAESVVEDDAFLGPGVVMTNDDTMGRHPRGERLQGPIVRRAARIGGGVVLLPGVEVGEEAFVAAGAVVIRDVPARGVVMGVPGRVVRQVDDEDLLERWR